MTLSNQSVKLLRVLLLQVLKGNIC